jgi:hypothetical protein
LIYGVVLVLLLVPVATLGLIGAMRLFEGGLLQVGSSTGYTWLHDPMWIVYTFFGGVFFLAGLICWRKSKQPGPTH